MTEQEFKEKYFTDNFYWVNEHNYERLQNIGVELGCVNPSGVKSIIQWHDGFKNLGFRTRDENNGVTKFQKEPFLLHNHTATSFDEMIQNYESLKHLARNGN